MSRMKHTQVLDSTIPEKWSLLHPHDMHEGIILSILLCDTKHITPTHYLSLALVPIKRQQIIRQTLLAQLILSSSLCKGICFCVSVEGFVTFEWKNIYVHINHLVKPFSGHVCWCNLWETQCYPLLTYATSILLDMYCTLSSVYCWSKLHLCIYRPVVLNFLNLCILMQPLENSC